MIRTKDSAVFGKESTVEFHSVWNIVAIEPDAATGWIKARCATGDVFLLQPRDMLTLMAWSQGNAQTLRDSQQTIDQEALSPNAERRQARPVRRRPLPLPIIQISQALPCLLCTPTTMTMTAIVDLNADRHAPWPLYTFCEYHLQLVLTEREATGGLSLRAIVQRLLQTPPS